MRNVKEWLILRLPAILIIATFLGCHPWPKGEIVRPEEALTPVDLFYPDFRDDLDLASLSEALRRNLDYLHRLDPGQKFQYGADAYSCKQVIETQQAFLELIGDNPDPRSLNKEIEKRFKVYRAAGRNGTDKVLFTGYFEPVYEASLTPGGLFRYPVYRKPDDLLKIDLSSFNQKFKGEKIVARLTGEELLPYFSRSQIDVEKSLEGRNLEIAWLKSPVDAAFLHIQGSGRLKLKDGSYLSIGYHASNGRPYRSIGQYMIEKGFLTQEEMSMQAIRAYLAEHPDKINEILNHNSSYVFFQVLENGPKGNINVPLTPQRSIATDVNLFPKGALAFIRCRKPTLDGNGRITGWVDFSRFVLNQDTGGAIKGAGRADIFWGRGTYAEAAAGHLKHEGDLFMLIRKP